MLTGRVMLTTKDKEEEIIITILNHIDRLLILDLKALEKQQDKQGRWIKNEDLRVDRQIGIRILNNRTDQEPIQMQVRKEKIQQEILFLRTSKLLILMNLRTCKWRLNWACCLKLLELMQKRFKMEIKCLLMLLLVVDLVLVKGLLKFKEPELNLLQKLKRQRRKLLELWEAQDKLKGDREGNEKTLPH